MNPRALMTIDQDSYVWPRLVLLKLFIYDIQCFPRMLNGKQLVTCRLAIIRVK